MRLSHIVPIGERNEEDECPRVFHLWERDTRDGKRMYMERMDRTQHTGTGPEAAVATSHSFPPLHFPLIPPEDKLLILYCHFFLHHYERRNRRRYIFRPREWRTERLIILRVVFSFPILSMCFRMFSPVLLCVMWVFASWFEWQKRGREEGQRKQTKGPSSDIVITATSIPKILSRGWPLDPERGGDAQEVQ